MSVQQQEKHLRSLEEVSTDLQPTKEKEDVKKVEPPKYPQPTSEPSGLFVAPSIPVDVTVNNDNLLSNPPTFSPTQSIALGEDPKVYSFNQELKTEKTIAIDADIVLVFVSIILALGLIWFFCRRFSHK